MPARNVILIMWLLAGLCNAEESKPADEAQMKRWIAELGAEEFETRQNAFAKLKRAGAAAEPVLESTKKSGDVEIHSRIADLLQPFYARRAKIKDWGVISERLGPVFGADLKAPLADDDAPGVALEPSVDPLKWLAKSQEADGHWDSMKHGAQSNADIEQTAFALLSFLGAGHTEKVGEYKMNVRGAVAWLSAHTGADGSVRLGEEREVHGLRQALAGLALAEAAGMANLAKTKETAQKVTDYSCEKHQCGEGSDRGGFGLAPKSEKPDLLTTTMFVMHLKSSKVAGLKVPSASFDGAIKFLDSVDDKEKGFSFAPGLDPSARASAMGLVCRLFLGWKREDLEEQFGRHMKNYGDPAACGSDDLCNWIGQLAAFQQGGTHWHKFNSGVRRSIASRQQIDGNFEGSIEPRGEWIGAGRVLSSALSALCLEVYYRYQMLR